LEAEGASFGCVYGWERPNWFAKEGGKILLNFRVHHNYLICQ
jgi:glycine cleavage system aminomethyltransferase T